MPFELGKNRRIAAKIIDDRLIECLKIIVVEQRFFGERFW